MSSPPELPALLIKRPFHFYEDDKEEFAETYPVTYLVLCACSS